MSQVWSTFGYMEAREILKEHIARTAVLTDAELLSLSNADREKLCNEIHQVEYFFRWRVNRG
jgi:hypothetical protein